MASRAVAIACQGGGSHAAFTGGVLPALLGEFDNLARAHAGAGQACRENYRAAYLDDYREAGADQRMQAPVLVAISGTSGGAISALLGGYGFITGGPDEARRRLDSFWDNNSATRWLEAGVNHYARGMSDAAAMFGWDVKPSPYAYPRQAAEWLTSTAWPTLAQALGPDNPWMRPDHFALPQLLRPAVDWQLIEAWGDFASIPLEVQRWERSALQAAMFAPDAPCQAGYRAQRPAIQERIEDQLGAPMRLRARLEQLGIPDGSLLGAAGVDGGPDGASDRAQDGACRVVGGRGTLVVDGSTLDSTGLAGDTAPRALVRWCAGAAWMPRSTGSRCASKGAASWPTTSTRAVTGA